MRNIVAFVAAVALTGTTALAQQQGQPTGTTGARMSAGEIFEQWDADNNDRLSRQEFMTGVTKQNFFERADKDKDRKLSMQEFTAQMNALNVYKKADLNDDGTVAPREVNRLVGADAQPKEWSTRQPASLTQNELYTGVFNAWDQNDDSFLSQDEYASGIYRYVDQDDSGWLSQNEYTEASGFLF